jgi:hypothetical protein
VQPHAQAKLVYVQGWRWMCALDEVAKWMLLGVLPGGACSHARLARPQGRVGDAAPTSAAGRLGGPN